MFFNRASDKQSEGQGVKSAVLSGFPRRADFENPGAAAKQSKNQEGEFHFFIIFFVTIWTQTPGLCYPYAGYPPEGPAKF